MTDRYQGFSFRAADLDELGVVRLRAAGGGLVYALREAPGGPGSHPGVALARADRGQGGDLRRPGGRV